MTQENEYQPEPDFIYFNITGFEESGVAAVMLYRGKLFKAEKVFSEYNPFDNPVTVIDIEAQLRRREELQDQIDLKLTEQEKLGKKRNRPSQYTDDMLELWNQQQIIDGILSYVYGIKIKELQIPKEPLE